MMMSSNANNKLQMCSVTQHQFRRHQMWGKFSQIHLVQSHFLCYKKWLVLTEQYQCRRCQMLPNFHKFTQYPHYLTVTKNTFSWLNNLFMVMLQFNGMLSYAKNKLHLCSVTQHQLLTQMWENFPNSPRVEILPWIACSVKTSHFL